MDISPDGVGFLAGAPLEEDDPLRFTISGKSTLMAEAAGELMWKDSASKRAGVRFTHVPEGLRTLIDGALINHKSNGETRENLTQNNLTQTGRTKADVESHRD